MSNNDKPTQALCEPWYLYSSPSYRSARANEGDQPKVIYDVNNDHVYDGVDLIKFPTHPDVRHIDLRLPDEILLAIVDSNKAIMFVTPRGRRCIGIQQGYADAFNGLSVEEKAAVVRASNSLPTNQRPLSIAGYELGPDGKFVETPSEPLRRMVVLGAEKLKR